MKKLFSTEDDPILNERRWLLYFLAIIYFCLSLYLIYRISLYIFYQQMPLYGKCMCYIALLVITLFLFLLSCKITTYLIRCLSKFILVFADFLHNKFSENKTIITDNSAGTYLPDKTITLSERQDGSSQSNTMPKQELINKLIDVLEKSNLLNDKYNDEELRKKFHTFISEFIINSPQKKDAVIDLFVWLSFREFTHLRQSEYLKLFESLKIKGMSRSNISPDISMRINAGRIWKLDNKELNGFIAYMEALDTNLVYKDSEIKDAKGNIIQIRHTSFVRFKKFEVDNKLLSGGLMLS